MNMLDVALVAVLASAVYGGYRLGLTAGATSWVFLLQGLVLASLASPVLVDAVGGHDAALRLILGAILFFAAGVGAQFLGRLVGTAFRRELVPEHLLATDKVAGAVAAPLTVLVIVWLIVLPPMAQVPGWPANLVHRSALARGLEAALPEAPDASHALRRLTGPVAQPEVLTALGPAGDSSPPPRTVSLSQAVVSRVEASTVKVEGEACLLDREGSGFAIDHDLVVTNAHVVAGEEQTTVVRPDGARLPAVVAVFDAGRDLALLRVKGLDQAPLVLGTAREGSTGAVFGHPGGQDEVAVSPAAIRQQLVATVHDADLPQPARRSVFVLAANLEPGDSGGALVTPAGTVAGVAFAVSSARTGVAYALTTDELLPLLGQDRSGVADTGPCF
jgi:S1-C subfamily serine protease